MKTAYTTKPAMKLSMSAVKRLLSYLKQYKAVLAVVMICILLSAGATAASSLFLQVLVDRYIMPLLAEPDPVFTGLLQALLFIAVVYGIGVVSSWVYNRLMINVAQLTLKRIRDEMFSKMQCFPVKYFDTHTHGDIMSCYTNDTDTLRQMITQSMPQLVSSVCTIVTVFFAMLYQSVYLTAIVAASVFSILKVIKFIAKKSGYYFVRQQETLGQLNGYVEEMINGQKVIKVFCREKAVKAAFREKNRDWQESAAKANSYANVIMPFMNALGYFQYVIVALVGATGAGKTTVTNLINRFYDIDSGTITYDGIPITRIKKEDLRRSLGIVLQEVHLFTGTIMENIRFGNLNASDEQCIEAAKLANAHNFIMMLPNGYDTVIEGNKNSLSQGQRQLLSIARAAVSNPPVMILDEATSSIDTRTEALVQKGMDRLMEGRTVFVIAHRLSTVMNSDVIMVLDHGEIIERGTHKSLIDKRGTYYRLYTGAFELE